MPRVLPVGLVLALSWIAPSHAPGPSDTYAVRSVVAGFAEALNRHDMDAFGRLFTPDADFVNVAGSWWKGRVAIQHKSTNGKSHRIGLRRQSHWPFSGLPSTSQPISQCRCWQLRSADGCGSTAALKR